MKFSTGIIIFFLAMIALVAEIVLYFIFGIGATISGVSGIVGIAGVFVWLMIMTVAAGIGAPICGLIENLTKKENIALYIFLPAMALVGVGGAALMFFSTQITSRPSDAQVQLTTPVSSSSQQKPAIGNWTYNSSTDEMSGKASHTARVNSTNTVNFSFPYQGEQHATLALRKHPRQGNDVLLLIERGQFMAHASGVQVLARFDDGAPMKLWATGPNDNSTTMLFIRGYPKFVALLKKAKVVKITTSVYNEGNPVFEFNVAGLSDF